MSSLTDAIPIADSIDIQELKNRESEIIGRAVISAEIDVLTALSAMLGDGSLAAPFRQAVDIVLTTKGRLVTTGMGKSGYVARKIASTLASTGTPSHYVHPAEAGHGDLGMVTVDDILLMLSNSGETTELSDLLTYSRHFMIPIIAITSRVDSALGRLADTVLLLPPMREACLIGLAPTSSTTAMLALGDALAIAVQARRNFSAGDFHRLHPSGRLGQSLLTVGELMHHGDALPLAKRGTLMREALLIMTAKSFGCIGITSEDGTIEGMITDGDLRRHMVSNLLDMPVEKIMTAHPRVITPETLAVRALQHMNIHKITSLFIVDKQRPLGILHLHDCLRARLL